MPQKKFKILLVDDDEIIRIYFHDIFWMYGFENRCELTVAGDLDQAETIVADPDRRPDIVFLDLVLPKKDGDRTVMDPKNSFAFLDRIKTDSATKHAAVFIFSSHSEGEYQKEAMKRGAAGFIHKEQTLPKDIVAIVNQALGAIKK
jgi:DNA-binding NarL/FixJ family response regulator